MSLRHRDDLTHQIPGNSSVLLSIVVVFVCCDANWSSYGAHTHLSDCNAEGGRQDRAARALAARKQPIRYARSLWPPALFALDRLLLSTKSARGKFESVISEARSSRHGFSQIRRKPKAISSVPIARSIHRPKRS